jgi:hypothetical protein
LVSRGLRRDLYARTRPGMLCRFGAGAVREGAHPQGTYRELRDRVSCERESWYVPLVRVKLPLAKFLCVVVGLLLALFGAFVVVAAYPKSQSDVEWSQVGLMSAGAVLLVVGFLLIAPGYAIELIQRWKWVLRPEPVTASKPADPVLAEVQELRRLVEDQGTVASAVTVLMTFVGFFLGWLVGGG